MSQPGDIYEQEAEKVAEQVVSSPPTAEVTSIKGLSGDEKQVQRKEGTSGTSSPNSVIQNPSRGQPINTSTRSTLESHLRADLSNVRVHDDSSAHEGWHAVQQAQGRVKPTMQAKSVAINDDEGLEREADVMGKKAAVPQGSGSIESDH